MRPSTVAAILIVLLSVPLTQALIRAQQPAQPATTLTQAEAVSPGIPPGNVPPSETLSWMLALSVVANGLMRWIKGSAWFPQIKAGAGKINIVIAAILAGATSLGIHTEFDTAAGTLLITGLQVASVTHFAGEWLRQYAIQHLTYRATELNT